ncbi:MAG: DNA polymerase III subunit delta, partial [Deltaproteobacteria bacterium]|nr:DNA polymerase III subunit delta [Deltaproteobacteria bacterium]
LEKLLTYVGDKTTVTVADVDEIFLDQAGAWVFDLTAALAQRNTVVALIQLRRLL